MTLRTRLVALAAVALLVVLAAGAYAVREVRHLRATHGGSPDVPTAAAGSPTGPRIVFRHTGTDAATGRVAWVALDDPGGPRHLADVSCDRIAAWAGGASCLATERGVVTRFVSRVLDADLVETDEVELAGIPSRTRVSPEAELVATTSFVSGHSYMTVGFSTLTTVRSLGDGTDHGNLEDFTLVLDGREVAPVDRNVWGVTFVDEQNFYATVASGGHTWLVAGDLAARTLTSVTRNAECPSLSPDGTRVAFKTDHAPGAAKDWGLTVLDLATGERTDVTGVVPGLDDQAAWLDDDTLMYGLPRADEPGVSDVWSLDVAAGAEPQLLIEQASSPTVVR